MDPSLNLPSNVRWTRPNRGAVLRGAKLGAVSLAPLVPWLAAYAACHALHRWHPLPSASIWGLLVLASFTAWGSALARILSRDRGDGWGFHATVGMALTVAVFAVLACLRLVSTAAIFLWCAAGPVVWSVTNRGRASDRMLDARWVSSARRWVTRLPRRHLFRPGSFVFDLALVILYAMAGIQYAESITNSAFNPWDDDGSYRAFARQFLDTGTLYQPFSYRRIGAYGGQSLLQAFVLARTDGDRLHMLDNGLCPLVILGLITGFRNASRPAARVAILAAGFLAMTLPHTPHNTGSELSGVVFFLALFRLFDGASFESAKTWSNALLIGFLGAAVGTLRQNYLSAAVAFIGLVYLSFLISPGARPRTVWFKQGVAAAGALLLFLTPWFALSIWSARTPFYPIINGNITTGFGFVGTVKWDEMVRWSLANMFTFQPVQSLALFFAAGFFLPTSRRTRAVHALMIACALSFALMMHFFQNFDDASSIARYYLAFTVAFAIAVTLRSLGDAGSRLTSRAALGAAAMAVTAVGIQFVNQREAILNHLFSRVTALRSVLYRGPNQSPEERDAGLYRRLQESVPPQAAMLAMVDRTYLLDGKRNRLFFYDHPGAIGPRPGPPCFEGARAFQNYLHSVGVRYLAYQLGPSSPEYNLDLWQKRAAAADPATAGRGGFYKNQARFELDFFSVLSSLSSTRASLFKEGDFRVLDLESPSK